jgi:hypothetical protein
LIGGLAAVLHGSPLTTADLDICPEKSAENLDRLARALRELDARIRTPDRPAGVPFPHDPAFLESIDLLNLVTAFGDLDLAFRPSGTTGYVELARSAREIRIGSAKVPVASLEDVIRSKEAAGRPRDLRALPVLRQLLEEIRKRRT